MLPRKPMFHSFLFAICTLILFSEVHSSPPPDPIKCYSNNKNCTITNSFGAFPDRSICRAAEVAYPRTEQELITVVATATSRERKMKVATSTFHSTPKLVCPQGEDGLLVSTKFLNQVLEINDRDMTMTVETGVTLKQLIDEAARAGLALPYVPYWWGLTVGGMLGTGAHGSTLWGGSAVHDSVVQMRIVTPTGPEDGFAKVRTLTRSDPDLDAAKVSLGVLGVISQVTLKLEPLFKRSIKSEVKTDTDLGDQVGSFGEQHEFADILWYPSQQKVIYRIDDRVPNTVPGNGLFNHIGFRPRTSTASAVRRAIIEETQESAEKATTVLPEKFAFGLTNNDLLFTGYPVVGDQNCLESSESCPWNPRIKGQSNQERSAFSITLPKVKDFIEDMQKLVESEPNSLCDLDEYVGILIRYVKASTAYLGKEEDSVEFDISYYQSKDPTSPKLCEHILEEIEQIGVFKYGGLPHWGKNQHVPFHQVINKYSRAGEFLNAKERYDPLGLFSSEWTDQVLGLRGGLMIANEGCALEGLCVCSEDIHCAPSKGYFCRPGRIYKEARVCTRLTA